MLMKPTLHASPDEPGGTACYGWYCAEQHAGSVNTGRACVPCCQEPLDPGMLNMHSVFLNEQKAVV